MVKSHERSLRKRSVNFDKKTLTISHLLHPYVKQRIKIGERFGILPKNMFQPNGIIDEVVLKIYEEKIHEKIALDVLKLLMFEKMHKNLKSLFEKEKWHKNSISIKGILDEELKSLEEIFTVDAANELIMNEELDDISYHQKDFKSDQHAYEESQENVLLFIGVQDIPVKHNDQKKNLLLKMYDSLPLQTSNVVDLYVLGKLNIKEIAMILKIDIVEVKRIIQFIKENFKKQLI